MAQLSASTTVAELPCALHDMQIKCMRLTGPLKTST